MPDVPDVPDAPQEPTTSEAKPEPEAAAPPKKRRSRARSKEPAPEAAPAKAETPASDERETSEETPVPEELKVPRRATVDERTRTLLGMRRALDARRPVFGRQAAHRYYRIGRDGTWRRPRGLQSKQRRHYGYRPRIVRIGYRSPARVRGLVPSGFKPILVRTSKDLAELDARTEAAIIARTVGTRRRLVLEEEARKLGIRVLNPIVKAEAEE